MASYTTLLELSTLVSLRSATQPNFCSWSLLQPLHSPECLSCCQTGTELYATPSESSIAACTAFVGTTAIASWLISWSKFGLRTGTTGAKSAWCDTLLPLAC